MASTSASPAATTSNFVGEIDQALMLLVRLASLPRTHETFAREAGVTIERGALVVLARLDDQGSIRPSELARILGVEPSTVTRHVQDLCRRELVAKQPDPTDGRSCVLQVTAEGRRALTRYRVARRRFLEQLLSNWAPGDLSGLADGLGRLVTDLTPLGDAPDNR